MTTDHFETVAAELEISHFNRDFKMIVTEFFDAVIKAIIACQPEFIGHMKGFCKGTGTDYLQVSYVSAKTGIGVNGQWDHNPESVRFTLNIIVLGIEHSRIQAILDEILLRDAFRKIFSYSRPTTP